MCSIVLPNHPRLTCAASEQKYQSLRVLRRDSRPRRGRLKDAMMPRFRRRALSGKSKYPEATMVRKGRRQAAKAAPEQLPSSRAKAVGETRKGSNDQWKSFSRGGSNLKTERRSLEPDTPVWKVRSESRFQIPEVDIEPSQGHSLDTDKPSTRQGVEGKPATPEGQSLDPVARLSVNKASQPRTSNLRKKGLRCRKVLQEVHKQEQKLRK